MCPVSSTFLAQSWREEAMNISTRTEKKQLDREPRAYPFPYYPECKLSSCHVKTTNCKSGNSRPFQAIPSHLDARTLAQHLKSQTADSKKFLIGHRSAHVPDLPDVNNHQRSPSQRRGINSRDPHTTQKYITRGTNILLLRHVCSPQIASRPP